MSCSAIPSEAEPSRLLDSLLADAELVAYARFARGGVLIHANAAFEHVCGACVGKSTLIDLVAEGQQAEMARIIEGGELPSQPTNVHFAVGTQAPTSLMVSWAWEAEHLVMIGEPPLADLQATQDMLVRLNGRVSDLARDNAKKSAHLERALDDLRQAQTALVQREKMAALGQMTAGVAHELNNPLSYVKNNLYLLGEGIDNVLALINLFGEGIEAVETVRPELFDELMDKIEAIDLVLLGERLPELVESTNNGIERAAHLVDSLRTFSRLDEAEIKTIDLNESLKSVVEFAGFLIKETHTEFTTDYGELPLITCSPGHLNQAVLNILTNAIQASAPGGKVRLTTELRGDDVLIRIMDDGPGVPEELTERIFDPFFTTRAVGEGTGLGLSIAHTVVTAQRGYIAVQKSDEGGAEFIIHLPLSKGVTP